MWESRRDFQRVWEGWKAGIMAFHPFHTLSFPWPVFRPATWINSYAATRAMCRVRHQLPIGIHCLSMSALAIWHKHRPGSPGQRFTGAERVQGTYASSASKILRHSGMTVAFKTTFEVFTRVGPDNSLERLTEGSVGLVTDRPSDVYELFVTLL
jgi:hypothetical protein